MMRSLLRWVFPIHLFQTNVAAAVVGSAVVGGAISASASRSAAGTQADAADRATAAQQGMFDQTVRNNAPYNQAGQAATGRLSSLLGIGPQPMVGGTQFDPSSINVPTTFQAGQSGDPLWEKILQQYNDASMARFGTGMNRSWSADADAQNQYQQLKQQYLDAKKAELTQSPGYNPGTPDPQYGSFLRPFSMEDFHLDPGIQFQTQQGNLALTNSAAARNGVLSGGAVKDFIAYNQGMAGTGYQSAYDRYMQNRQFTLGSLMGVSQLGQTAASNGSSGGSSYAQGIAGTMTGAGNALGAGQMGAGNALSGGISGAANGYMLSRFLNNGNGGADLGPVTTSANPNGVYIAPNA